MKFSLLVVLVCMIAKSSAINWQGNWALDCDFSGNDLKGERMPGSQCGGACGRTPGCTHFTWTSHQGGTCWMKKGAACKASAHSKSGAVCGVVTEDCSGDNTETDNIVPVSDGSAIRKLTNCKFTYGRNWKGDNINYSAYKFITQWTGYASNGNTNFNIGDMVKKTHELNKIPVFFGYHIAFEARHEWNLQDCNVGHPSLCEKGANYIRAKRSHIVERYNHYAKNVAQIMGRDKFVVWLIEPDFWQYYGNHKQEGGPLSGQEMRSFFDDIASNIKKELPNAAIAWDISPWLSEGAMRTWWGYFASSPYIDFLFTSGGGGQGNSQHIHGNELRWAFMSQLTGKKIIGDSGYGVAGVPVANNAAWYDASQINWRVQDGVVAVSLADPSHDPHVDKSVC